VICQEMTADENNGLSSKAKENLRRNAESRESNSKFIKLQPNEKRILKFDAEKIEQRETDFNGRGRKTMQYIYTVTEPNNGNQEKVLEVGKRTSQEIDSHLGEGRTLLMVQRFGLGLDTRYHVIPAS
jgi:hypothetical protein